MPTKKMKQTVPTSKMFKPSKPKVASQSTTTHAMKQPEHSKITESSLSDALQASLANTSQHLRTTFNTTIDRTHSNLLTFLAEAATRAEGRHKVEKEVSSLMTRSLAEEVLEFTSRQGPKTSSSLGDRMARFDQKVDRSRERLHELTSELARIEVKLKRCCVELEEYLTTKKCQGERCTGGEDEHGDGDRDCMRGHWEQKIDEMLNEKMDKMEASEQEFNVREKRKSAKFVQSLDMGL